MDVSKHIDRAEKEVARKNYDLAISLYDQILAIQPDEGRARTGKRRAELAKHQKAYPSALTRGIKNLVPQLAIAIGKAVRAHGLVASMAEKALSNDPKNVKLNLVLGHALLAKGHKNGAESAFAVVAEFDPNDIESMKTLGRLYYDNKKYEESLACYERVIKVAPRDQEAVKMRKNLAAEGAIKSGGFEKAKSARDLAKSSEQMAELERRQRLVRSAEDVEAALEEAKAAVRENPERADLQRELGNLYFQKRDLPRAAECFEEALRLQPDDFETSTRLGDVRLLDLDTRIRELREEAKEGVEGAADMLRRLNEERRGFRVEEFRRRVKAHPTDTGLRFRLGQYLLEDDELDDAIAEFQAVVKDPKRKFQAMTLMGKAFAKKGMWDLATKQLEAALEGMGGVDEKNLEILYTLATSLEEQGRREDALARFSQIYEIDISFRDVAKRIEVLRRAD
ncbi:MAG: tetratricopeptide repeat protein [Planctomycetota bacterium]